MLLLKLPLPQFQPTTSHAPKKHRIPQQILHNSIAKLVTLSQYTDIPSARYAQSANLINDKIYFVGGWDEKTFQIDVFYLDLSADFGIDNLPFKRINLNSSLFIAWHTANVYNDTQIIIIGGVTLNKENNQNILSQNESLIKLNESTIESFPLSKNGPSTRRSLNSVIDNTGTIYIFSGSNQADSGPTRGNLDTTMYKLKVVQNTWSAVPYIGSVDSALMPAFDYTATLLDDGRIIYIGGEYISGDRYRNMNEVWIYYTTTDKWEFKNCSGVNVKERASHTAVLGPDRFTIIIYGGYSLIPLTNDQALFILDTKKWRWSLPNINNPPVIRHGHTATMYNNYMIVAFGAQQEDINSVPISKNVISILDTNNNSYSWVEQFKLRDIVPIPSESDTPSPTTINPSQTSVSETSSSSRLGIIIGSMIGSAAVIIVAVIVAVFFYRRRRERQIIAEGHMHSPQVVNVENNRDSTRSSEIV
ncbi:9259_t:CDS:2 [Ambispora gerdemannii]|uniref:9259_t:CDS:1 n=1 Tax=Ambispora gerdemannii TaxID=144530 RepID=A0A9N9AB52_9GLOM|nr:9259_t:CDS:2 [Ambispora gerdemannii]